MKIKFLPLFLWTAAMSGAATIGVYAADYCTSGLLTRTEGDRNLTSFEITDGTNTVNVNVNQPAAYGSATYFDRTSSVLTVQPGATIDISSINWAGSWMHAYIYVDYDKDGEFDTILNADGSNDGELVSYLSLIHISEPTRRS